MSRLLSLVRPLSGNEEVEEDSFFLRRNEDDHSLVGKPKMFPSQNLLKCAPPNKMRSSTHHHKGWRYIIERQGQREYEREHNAVTRGLRLDGACIEKEGRSEHETKLSKERAKRQNNFAWLEGEQAVMAQKVRMGDGLVKGGAMGLAKAKVATGKMGIEKGGKF